MWCSIFYGRSGVSDFCGYQGMLDFYSVATYLQPTCGVPEACLEHA